MVTAKTGLFSRCRNVVEKLVIFCADESQFNLMVDKMSFKNKKAFNKSKKIFLFLFDMGTWDSHRITSNLNQSQFLK